MTDGWFPPDEKNRIRKSGLLQGIHTGAQQHATVGVNVLTFGGVTGGVNVLISGGVTGVVRAHVRQDNNAHLVPGAR